MHSCLQLYQFTPLSEDLLSFLLQYYYLPRVGEVVCVVTPAFVATSSSFSFFHPTPASYWGVRTSAFCFVTTLGASKRCCAVDASQQIEATTATVRTELTAFSVKVSIVLPFQIFIFWKLKIGHSRSPLLLLYECRLSLTVVSVG